MILDRHRQLGSAPEIAAEVPLRVARSLALRYDYHIRSRSAGLAAPSVPGFLFRRRSANIFASAVLRSCCRLVASQGVEQFSARRDPSPADFLRRQKSIL
jgi:hypothetical protein